MARLLIAAAAALTMPAVYMRLAGVALAAPPVEAAVFGSAVLGAAALLAWGAEVAQLDISKGFAVALLALIAVLPEYAVDLYFAWAAAERPEYAAYATANMTGANRLLVGAGWPAVVLIYALVHRRRSIPLAPEQTTEVAYLAVATLYAFLIALKGSLSLLDTAVLVFLFGAYFRRAMAGEVGEPELIGPAAQIARLPRTARRSATIAIFIGSGVVILLSAEPFAEALIESGQPLGIDEFLLVQWVAPFASEAPELFIAGLWAFRGDARAGLATLISSKVNQWTLLIGTIPLAYSIGLGRPGALPLDLRQEQEIWLTAAQSLFAVAILIDMDLDLPESIALLLPFLAQLVIPQIRIEAAAVYTLLAVLLILWRRRDLKPVLRSGLLETRR